jgi:hypothetical protein
MFSFGFTLVELMFVVAVIAVLAGLLLPGISRSLSRAHQANCFGNHKQLALAWQMYVDDWQGRLVCNVDDGDGVPQFTNWVSGTKNNRDDIRNINLLVDASRSLLGKYIGNARVYKCPSDRDSFVRSVSMNNRLNPVRFLREPLVLGGNGTNYKVFKKIDDVGTPDGIFVISDERSDSINEGNLAVDLSNTGNYLGVGIEQPYWWLDTPASYHSKGVVLSFADGHVERHQWQEKTTLGPYGVTGFRRTSISDRDIAWFQRRTSERIR